MANPWFRLYSEFDADPKVQSMPEHMQRRLIMFFCETCRDETVTMCDEDRAFHWRVTLNELQKTKALFVSKGFCDETWKAVNWEKRQCHSDNSKERTRKWRERNKENTGDAVTDGDGHSDGLEQNRTDKNRAEQTIAPSSPELTASAPPIGTLPCTGEPKVWHLYQTKVDEWQETYPGIDVKAELRKARQWLIDNPTDRKTSRGMTRFLNRWLARTQNEKGGNSHGKGNHVDIGRTGQIKKDLAEALARMGSKETGEDTTALHDGEVRH